MADHFLSSLQNIKQSFSLSDIDFEFMNNFPGLIPNQQLMGFHQDSFYPGENFEQALITSQTNTSVSHVTDQMVSDYCDSKDRKRKSMDICTPESSSVYSSPQGSENGTTKNVSVFLFLIHWFTFLKCFIMVWSVWISRLAGKENE